MVRTGSVQSCHQTPIFPYRGRARQTKQGGYVGLHSREGVWVACRVGGAASREGGRGCTAGRVGGAAQQGGWVGLHSRDGMWAGFLPFTLPRLHPPLSMPSSPQIPSSTPTSSPYSIILFADCDHWTRSLPWCKVLRCRLDIGMGQASLLCIVVLAYFSR